MATECEFWLRNTASALVLLGAGAWASNCHTFSVKSCVRKLQVYLYPSHVFDLFQSFTEGCEVCADMPTYNELCQLSNGENRDCFV